jgi:DNA-binding NarL/FixJ family response regulator
MGLGFLKWLAGNIFDENTLREKLSIPSLVLLMNVMMIVWLIFYSKKVNNFKVFGNKKTENKNKTKDLIQKYGISKREMEVIELICEGCSNKEIANRLFISVDTVKDHNSRIYLKTEVKNRTQLAKLFLE